MPLGHHDLTMRRANLLATPQAFLRRNVIYEPGAGAPAVSGIVNVYLFESGQGTRPGSRLGVLTRRFHTTEELSIQCANPNALLGGGAIAMGAAGWHQHLVFPAHWIATTFHPPAAAAAAFPWYALPNAGGPDLMFTQRLSGCCVLHRPAVGGAGTEIAHIMPTPPETGAALQARMSALFPGGGVSMYGRNQYGMNRATMIVGVRSGGAWTFFAQKRDVLTPDVRSVHQF